MAQITNNETITIGTTSGQVSDDRDLRSTRRNWISLTNTSTGGQIITLAPGNVAAVALVGLVLSPGSTITLSHDQYSLCWQGPIQGIASGAGAALAITENMEVRS